MVKLKRAFGSLQLHLDASSNQAGTMEKPGASTKSMGV